MGVSSFEMGSFGMGEFWRERKKRRGWETRQGSFSKREKKVVR